MTTRLAPLLLAACLSGCAYEPALTNKLVDYNRAFEESSNAIMLLNVLRAKDRKPLYFTTLSQLNPNIQASGSLTVAAPGLAPNLYTILGVAGQGTVSSSNTGTVATEHTQEFTRAFLTPVSMETFEYFWSQGWPREMLLTLLIRRIEIVGSDENGMPERGATVNILENRPRSKAEFERFRGFIQVLEEHVRFAKTTKLEPVGPKVKADQTGHLRDLFDASKGGFEIVRGTDGTFQVTKRVVSVSLCFPDPAAEADHPSRKRATQFGCNEVAVPAVAAPARPVRGARRAEPEQGPAIADTKEGKVGSIVSRSLIDRLSLSTVESDGQEVVDDAIRELQRRDEQLARFKAHFSRCRQYCTLVLYVRSPEALIYYLGEVMRVQEDSGYRTALSAVESGNSKIFDARPGLPHIGGTDLSVQYDGTIYHIPKDRRNRAMHALSLLSQLLGLQRRAADLPRTTTVNVVRP